MGRNAVFRNPPSPTPWPTSSLALGALLVASVTLAACSSSRSDQAADAGSPDSLAADRGAHDSSQADSRADGGTSADTRPDAAGQTYQATLAVDGQLLLPCTLGGKASFCAIDTGASPTAVHNTFASTPLLAQVDVAVGPIEAKGHGVGVTDLSHASSFVGWPLGALIGSDLLAPYHVALDYRAQPHPSVSFSKTPLAAPQGVIGAAQEVPFKEVLGVPVVSATLSAGGVEVKRELIADTGSGVTVLKRSTWDALVAGKSLPKLEGYRWLSNSGETQGFVTRLPSLKIGGAEVRESWAIIVPDDHHLVGALGLAGLPAEFLGYPFYRRFVTVYEGPDKRYTFHPVAKQTVVPEGEWRRVGVELSVGKAGFTVEMVYSPSGAKSAGVQIGDELIAVDGKAVKGMGLGDVRKLLRGALGDERTLSLKRGGAALELTATVGQLL